MSFSGQSFTPDSISELARGNSASQPPVITPEGSVAVTWPISLSLRLHCTSSHVAARNVTVAHTQFHRLCPLPISGHLIEGLNVGDRALQGCTSVVIRFSDCHEASQQVVDILSMQQRGPGVLPHTLTRSPLRSEYGTMPFRSRISATLTDPEPSRVVSSTGFHRQPLR